MNTERMLKLLAQAALDTNQDPNGEYHAPMMEQFAKLIIKECIAQNNVAIEHLRNEPEDIPGWRIIMNLTRISCNNQIKDHFGIDQFEAETHKGWICSKCGVDRTKDVCPKGHMAASTGDCPMLSFAQIGVK